MATSSFPRTQTFEIDEAPLMKQPNGSGSEKKKPEPRGSTNARDRHAPRTPPDEGGAEPRSPDRGESPQGIHVSLFDYSVENHFRAVDMVSKLCGGPEIDSMDPDELKRFSSSVTFLREWRYFSYQEKLVRFATQSYYPHKKNVVGEISLPQFSSAAVPKGTQFGTETTSESSADYVLQVGGLVWALDWCPRLQDFDSHIKNEFLAVAAHPPESSYHKIGAALAGRGVIQIWSLLNTSAEEDEQSHVQKMPKSKRGRPQKMPAIESLHNDECSTDITELPKPKKPRGRPRKEPADCKTDTTLPKSGKPRGRPRKKPAAEALHDNDCNTGTMDIPKLKRPRGRRKETPAAESLQNDDCNDRHLEALVVQYPDDSSIFESVDMASNYNHATQSNSRETSRFSIQAVPEDGLSADSKCKKVYKSLKSKAVGKDQQNYLSSSLPILDENEAPFDVNCQTSASCKLKSSGSRVHVSDSKDTVNDIPKDVALPRMVLCLAHNGKVAWDIKWRPVQLCDGESRHTMGYLAVLLGSGALEVWEVPFPHTIKLLYPAFQKEGTDPRFIKLEPVFKCSRLNTGGRQSIPLTLEWSASSQHNLILAGCHDGVVALWKFSITGSLEDTRPLLCFSADTVPIRALAWAPSGSDPEGAEVFVTAGHRGLKFWDVRDPFRPLWDYNPVQSVIYSLDWLPDPNCIVASFDDGALRFLSLARAALDVPVTGKLGTQQPNFHSSYSSSFTIWSLHASRLTGMVAYCGADGNTLCFQLTTKGVEGDYRRHRHPHFLCGSLTEEDSTLTLITSAFNTPFPMIRYTKEQKAKPQNSKQPLAVCFGNDQEVELASKDPAEQSKRDMQMNKKIELKPELEVFPSKFVAMHKVRWNMNKGSGRWLCYGGAAGLVRCQQADLSSAKILYDET